MSEENMENKNQNSTPVENQTISISTLENSPSNTSPTPSKPELTSEEKSKLEKQKTERKKKEKRKIMFSCLGAGCGALVLVFFGFIIFLSQAGDGINPLLKIFSIEQSSLTNTLIDISNLGFGIFLPLLSL